jgi:hypothetical protein
MSNQQQMDDFFKEKFDSYSPEVPADMWERIAATQKKRRVAIVWWRKWLTTKCLLIAAIAGMMIAGGLHFNRDKEMATTAINSANTTNSKNLSPVATENTVPSDKIVAIEDKLFNQKNIETTSNPITTNEINIAINADASTVNNKHVKKAIRKTVGNMSIHAALPEIAEENYNNTAANYTNVPVLNADNLDTKEQALSKIPFSFSAITALSLADKSQQQIVLSGIRPPGCPPAEKDAAGNKTYWEVYTGLDYASKKYNDTGNSVFAEKRKATTTFQSAYSAGFRFTRVFNNGVSFRTGINYSQINEKFSFIQSNLVQTTYIIDAISGDTTGSYTVRGTRYKTTYNKYRSIDIPLLLGYEAGNGRFHTNFNAGAIVNLYSWQKGELLDTNYQPVSITTGKGNDAFHYKTNAGIGFTAAASMYYKVNERLHLLAEPYFRYNLSPMSKDILSLQERFTTIGLRLGIRVDLQ